MLSLSSHSAPALGVSELCQCSRLCQGSKSHLQSLPVSLGSVSTRLVRR